MSSGEFVVGSLSSTFFVLFGVLDVLGVSISVRSNFVSSLLLYFYPGGDSQYVVFTDSHVFFLFLKSFY